MLRCQAALVFVQFWRSGHEAHKTASPVLYFFFQHCLRPSSHESEVACTGISQNRLSTRHQTSGAAEIPPPEVFPTNNDPTCISPLPCVFPPIPCTRAARIGARQPHQLVVCITVDGG